MNLITEAVLDEAIKAAEVGHVNGLTYDQSRWCGTACCVLGFARHIAGLPEQNMGPHDSEFSKSPKISTLRKLMRCGSSDILRIMKSVNRYGKINLSGADLRSADLSDADLRSADLSDAVLNGADLSGAVLRSAVLRSAVLRSAVLRRADLSDAVLNGADLSDADLNSTDLSGAVLRSAVLRSAVLSGAVLSGAVLNSTDLSGADLSGAIYWDHITGKCVEVTKKWLKDKGAIL